MSSFIPEGYQSKLDLYQTQAAIDLVKLAFTRNLKLALNLKRVSAPLFVDPETGLNDNLSGRERPVDFDIPGAGRRAEVVQSLAKWKRMALHRYGFAVGEGLYTDMNAIRRDEEPDNLHSVYVDQWDWERVIAIDERCMEYLKKSIQAIAAAVSDTLDEVSAAFPAAAAPLRRAVTFVTAQELEDLYPELDGKAREDRFVREHKTIAILQIGGKLRSGEPHDGRAPDYDDWALNADLLYWHEPLGRSFELSSMGIRVNSESLAAQLAVSGCTDRAKLPYHAMLLGNELPQTMGGGIGQSRLCMLLLQKAHIGEVQASIWDEETLKVCEDAGVVLL